LKVLLLSRYGRKGASTRLRFLQYLPHLAVAGVDVTTAPLLDDDYVSVLYAEGRRSMGRAGLAYIKRAAQLLTARRYDLLWIEKELFPSLPAFFERFIGLSGIRYVVDYDDAVYHNYDQHANKYIRLALSRKIDQVMKFSSLVVAGNQYLAKRAQTAGARQIEIMPTVVDLDRYPEVAGEKQGTFRIGWIGTPVTSRYLSYVRGPLLALAGDKRTQIVVVGLDRNPIPEMEIDVRRWSEAGEVAELQRFDVGIMPLPDEPWERGKCGYKLIQYMACSKPVVASPVGVNVEIVQNGINGFLANSEVEWQKALTTLRDNPRLRYEMGRAGRRLVEQRYCLSVTAPRLLRLLQQISTEVVR
jgi:glycosyltransferase involved in cell wall biosynthesis